MSTGPDLLYLVEGMSCEHCERAVTDEVMRVDGVRSVTVDLASMRVRVSGEGVGDDAVRAAIDEAGYDAVRL